MKAAPQTLSEVQIEMQAMGWDNGGPPGAIKRAEDGTELSKAPSEEWVSDMEEACNVVDARAALAELSRSS